MARIAARLSGTFVQDVDGNVIEQIERTSTTTILQLVNELTPSGKLTEFAPPAEPQPLAWVYVRRSDDKRSDGVSLANQIGQGTERMKLDGYAEDQILIVVEDDRSADLEKERPGWLHIHRQLALGNGDCAVGFKLDRWSRSVVEGTSSMTILQQIEARLYLWRDGIDTSTTMGRAQAHLALLFAEMELEGIKARFRAAREQAMEEGRWLGGPRPFGYVSEKQESGGFRLRHHRSHEQPMEFRDETMDAVRTVPEKLDKSEADIVRDGARKIIGGMPAAALAREWNEQGITTVFGKNWYGTSVSRMYRSPKMVGQQPIEDGDVLRDEGGKPRIVFEGLLSPADWLAVRRELGDLHKDGKRERAAGRTSLMAGRLRCGKCGGEKLVGCSAESNPKGSYRCRSVEGQCGKNFIQVGVTDEWVAEQLIGRINERPAGELNKAVAEVQATSPKADELAELEMEMAEVETAVASARGAVLATLSARAADLEDRIEQTQAEAEHRAATAGGPTFTATRKWWDSMPIERRQQTVDQLIEHLIIHPAVRTKKGRRIGTDRLEMVWRSPGATP